MLTSVLRSLLYLASIGLLWVADGVRVRRQQAMVLDPHAATEWRVPATTLVRCIDRHVQDSALTLTERHRIADLHDLILRGSCSVMSLSLRDERPRAGRAL